MDLIEMNENHEQSYEFGDSRSLEFVSGPLSLDLFGEKNEHEEILEPSPRLLIYHDVVRIQSQACGEAEKEDGQRSVYESCWPEIESSAANHSP